MIFQRKSVVSYSIASFVFPFIVYLFTLAPSVTFIDSGELGAVAAKLGVAHPTGYPLFTIIGNLFTKLPFGEEIRMLNLMSSVLSSLAVVILFNLILQLSEQICSGAAKGSIRERIVLNSSLAAALILAFSRTFWDTANAAEVYSLHTLFIALLLFLILKASGEIGDNRKIGRDRYWLIFAFVLGLSFTNHLSTIFLSVGCIYLYFATNGFSETSIKRIAVMALPFIIGFSVYIYLPVRADNNIMSWGNPHNFENFWRHFTGKQFSVWMFSSFENAEKQFSYFTKSFPMEFAVVPLLLALPGLVMLFSRARRVFNFTLLLFLFCVVYAINYDIYDIDSYFLLAFTVASVWIGCGLVWLTEKLEDKAGQLSYVFVLLPLIPLYLNFSKVDESKNTYVDDFTMNVFNTADSNSIIMSTQWDFWVSSSIYQQSVRNIRPDLIIIDKELLRKSWYFEYLKKHYPDFYEKSKSEIDAYYTELLKFEKFTDRYTNPRTESDKAEVSKIQSTFLTLLNSFLDKNYPDRSFYTTFEIEQQSQERFGKEFGRIPHGLLIKYTKNTGFDNFQLPDYRFTVTDRTDYHHNFLMNAYYSAYLTRANYVMNFSQFDEAERLISKALEIKPGSPEAIQLLNKNKQLKSMINNGTN